MGLPRSIHAGRPAVAFDNPHVLIDARKAVSRTRRVVAAEAWRRIRDSKRPLGELEGVVKRAIWGLTRSDTDHSIMAA